LHGARWRSRQKNGRQHPEGNKRSHHFALLLPGFIDIRFDLFT
jgi:hypothetical protein